MVLIVADRLGPREAEMPGDLPGCSARPIALNHIGQTREGDGEEQRDQSSGAKQLNEREGLRRSSRRPCWELSIPFHRLLLLPMPQLA
jgi:hypothetical protein